MTGPSVLSRILERKLGAEILGFIPTPLRRARTSGSRLANVAMTVNSAMASSSAGFILLVTERSCVKMERNVSVRSVSLHTPHLSFACSAAIRVLLLQRLRRHLRLCCVLLLLLLRRLFLYTNNNRCL